MKKLPVNNPNEPEPAARATPNIDDRLRFVPERPAKADAVTQAGSGLSSFVLLRMDALEKPKLEESLVEPDGGSGGSTCTCNSVCTCVPVDTCACNQVCTCDTVSDCRVDTCVCVGTCSCVGTCNGGCLCDYVYI